MAVNLSTLAPITTAASALSNLVLVSPQKVKGYQPQNGVVGSKAPTLPQPPSFLFDYEGEQTVSLESDITDHYIEDNTTIQDQWALKPEIVTTHGFIGELNNIAPKALQILQTAADKLTIISAYVPALSETALIAYNEAFLLYQTAASAVNSAVSAWSSINSSGGENVIGSSGLLNNVFNAGTGSISNNQNKQQIAFQLFYGYWNSRTLFTVQTPWAIFQNMAIQRLRAIQDAETRVISDFEITFKMMRFASTDTNISSIQQGRTATAGAPLVDFGTTTPATPSPPFGVTDGLSSIGIA